MEIKPIVLSAVVIILVGSLLVPIIKSTGDTFATPENSNYNFKMTYAEEYSIENVSLSENIINGVQTVNGTTTLWVLSDAVTIRMGVDRTSYISPEYAGNMLPGDTISFIDGVCTVSTSRGTFEYDYTKLAVPDDNGDYGAFFYGKTLYIPANKPIFLLSLGFLTDTTLDFTGTYVASTNGWSLLSGPFDTTASSATVPVDGSVDVSIRTTPYKQTSDVLRLSTDDITVTLTPADGSDAVAVSPVDFFVVAPIVASDADYNAPSWYYLLAASPILIVVALVVSFVAYVRFRD